MQVPILILPQNDSKNYILYFHGNAEDIGIARKLLYKMQEELQVNIIAMEYKGYGIYKGDSSHEQMKQDSQMVY